MIQAGCRLPPNSTKIYYRWGLEERLREASVKATGNLFAACKPRNRSCAVSSRLNAPHFAYADDTGRVYGGHDWEDEVIGETGGDFLCMHVSSLPYTILSLSALPPFH